MIHTGIRHGSSTIGAIICAHVAGASLLAQTPAKVDFARDIQPLFRDHCIECHGASQQMRGFRLDQRRDAMPNRVGANGVRIVPGNSAQSPLYRRVSATSSQMPPSAPLRPEQIALIKAWIDQGADWPDDLSGDRDTPADPAAVAVLNALRNGDRQAFARTLRENPGSVNAKGANGSTPLMYAALYGDREAVRLLLDKGANANAQNSSGATALMYATDSEEKSRLLLDHGADPNLRSGEGRTALLVAVGQLGSYPVVKLLWKKAPTPPSAFLTAAESCCWPSTHATQSCCSCFWIMAPGRRASPSLPCWWRDAPPASTSYSRLQSPLTFLAHSRERSGPATSRA